MCFGNTLRPHPRAENLDFKCWQFKRSTRCISWTSGRAGGRAERSNKDANFHAGDQEGWLPRRGVAESEGKGGVDLWVSPGRKGGREERRPRGGKGGGRQGWGASADAGGEEPGSPRSRAAAGSEGGRARRARAWRCGWEEGEEEKRSE